jgi:hypothetical protein
MRWLLLLGCVACSNPFSHREKEPPFEFHVRQRDGVTLIELQFATFEAASTTGPYMVTVTEGQWTRDVSADVNFCVQFDCTGTLLREQLVVTADPQASNPVVGFSCVGVDGTFYAGVDAGGSGDCAN